MAKYQVKLCVPWFKETNIGVPRDEFVSVVRSLQSQQLGVAPTTVVLPYEPRIARSISRHQGVGGKARTRVGVGPIYDTIAIEDTGQLTDTSWTVTISRRSCLVGRRRAIC